MSRQLIISADSLTFNHNAAAAAGNVIYDDPYIILF
jgi:hypothetical protein